MNRADDINYAIERFGLFRVAQHGTLHFNSIIYRVVLGLLFPEYASVVALFTLVEFILNAALEIPFGFFADKYGRVRSSFVGLMLISISVLFTYLTVKSTDMKMAQLFTIIAATLVGVGKPLFSGAIEAFYQDAIESRKKHESDNVKAETSFVLSSGFGKALPTIYIAGSFILVWILYTLEHAKEAFVIGSILWAIVAFRLLKDKKILGDHSVTHSPAVPVRSVLRSMLSYHVVWSSVFRALNWIIVIYVMGHGIIVIGNEKQFASTSEKVVLYLIFMMSFMGLGWFIRGVVNPYLVSRYGQIRSVAVLYGLFIFANLTMYNLILEASYIVTCALVFVYMTLFQICYSFWSDWVSNLLLKHVPKRTYATALSIQNIPGFFLVSLMSLYFMTLDKGYPGILEMYMSLIVLTCISLICLYFYNTGAKHAK